ncbi:DAO-domain-containing protein [Tricholoma matsutake]|nr:DAO-domain-containing protein [Tricholoma matsutake 945]
MTIIRALFSRRSLALISGTTVFATAGGYWYLNSGPAYPSSTKQSRRPPPPWSPPSRTHIINALKQSSNSDSDIFDILIVGGGATGAGIAVDAASRGLKVALVERDDFSAGTSSKSTKLVHGGVRYLQKAVFELDYEQYKLVREALHERRIFLHTAPYLSNMLPIMLPIYKYWQVPYYWAGCKMYDMLAGKENMESSYVMSKGKALETFPMLKSEGLVGAVVYYDGQHNDSRMNIALILSAIKHGATASNYLEATHLHKNTHGKLTGARLKDTLTGDEFNVRARGIINATGPFSDSLLAMDDPAHKPIVQPSSGIHITLPGYYSPRTMGLLDPATSDGRVIFFLPWQGNTIAGTTDTPASLERYPKAGEEEIRWVLDEVRRYLAKDIRVRRGDVLSAWSGLRPLVSHPNSKHEGTEGLVRSHVVHVSPTSGLLTVAGGKWTTYRAMAEEAVDVAVEAFGLGDRVRSGCVTESLRLVGSEGWSRNMFIGLIQQFGLDTDVAKHLSDNYGDRAWTVCSYPSSPPNQRLSPHHPFITQEITYAIHHEYAQTATDVLSRRTRLAFLNVHDARDAVPLVVDVMAGELGWGYKERKRQVIGALAYLETMGLERGSWERGEVRVLPRGWVERLFVWVGDGFGMGWAKMRGGSEGGGSVVGARTKFDKREMEQLRSVFERYAVKEKIGKEVMWDVLGTVGGYEGVSRREFEYVLEEAGVGAGSAGAGGAGGWDGVGVGVGEAEVEVEEREGEGEGKGEGEKREGGGVDFQEFVEICGSLKEVAFMPSAAASGKHERVRIPVEKSGGGI